MTGPARCRTTVIRLAIAVTAAAVLAAACGGNGHTKSAVAAAAPRPAATTSSAAATPEVATRSNGDLGAYLVDSRGRTLYVYKVDKGTTSACYATCAANWPAFTTTGGAPRAAGQVDAAKLGTTSRTDGTTQVTYSGHPLYYFAGDSAVGDTKGEGVKDVWYAVAPSGNAIDKS